MMSLLKKILMASTLLFLFNACGGISYIGYDHKQLMLQLDKNRLLLPGQVIGEKRDNFNSLYLSRKLIRLNDGTLLVYEDAQTDLSYEFEPMITRTVKIVFEAVRISTIYAKNNLFAYQLLLENGKVLNVIAQQSDTQELRLLYGMGTLRLKHILKALDPDASVAPYRQVLQLRDPSHALLTRWDVQKVHLIPLVVPIGRFMGPF
jgi:hypothetical protein